LISYAQNFEDVMLWRAFKPLARGFYIDVGAGDPEQLSVTRWFYELGWHGINVEPNPAHFVRLSACRKHDVNLPVALSDTSGERTFFLVVGSNDLATLNDEVAELHRQAGWQVEKVRTETTTLADVCQQYATASDIHFLKIDVEGAEKAVLAGADFARFRPWVVVVEATLPNSTVEAFSAWEPSLLRSGYRFVWFDGLNRFYVAEEHWEALHRHFHVPPNVFDGFTRAADSLREVESLHRANAEASALPATAETEYASSLLAAVREAEQAGQRAGAAEARAFEQATVAQRATRRADAAEERARRAEAEAAVAKQQEAVAALVAEARTTEVQAVQVILERIHSSTSWRITTPLRAAGWLLSKRAGAALMELGMSNVRAERLRSVAGQGSAAKRASRVAFYITARAATRVPGATHAANVLERLSPRAWRWLKRHDQAYFAAASLRLPASSTPRTARPGGFRIMPTSENDRGHSIRKVHQFHSGSNSNDAITNSMLLIQRQLRRLGYESDIFVEHRDHRLAEELFEMEDLPLHGNYVLIVHHSMGYDACEYIAALSARKILIYHNITPPEFLNDIPEAIPYANLGRQQLSYLRPHMTAALGQSELNALELRAHGYAAPVVCPLLFDVDDLIEMARNTTRPQGTPFTILFVGRVVASKGQADLIDAFAEFRRLYTDQSRLVLIGKTAGPDAPYPSEICQRIETHGLQNHVLIMGPVSDSELREWYATADLYVSLSFHEGFGVPLVEAMAYDVPVLAWPAGAIPYTLGGAGKLLTDRSPHAVAADMLCIAHDPILRADIVARQRQSLDRFRLDRHLPNLLLALASAGAAPPTRDASHSVLAANLHFVVAGHVNGSYSLAVINRQTAQALENLRPGTVRILPWENGPVADLQVPDRLRAPLERLLTRPPCQTGPEIVISQHYPVYVPPHRGDLTLALIVWEESLFPAETVRFLNDSFDAVLAPSAAVAKTLIDSGVSIPIRKVGQVPDLVPFFQIAIERESRERWSGKKQFTFLHVSSCFPRKGVDVLLAAYARAFRCHDPVRLVIKGFPNPHNDAPEQIERLQRTDLNVGEIVMINNDLDDAAMHDLYREANAMVLPTRGEGFNLPAAEAMAAGIPLIVTAHGGHLDFCTKYNARLVGFRFAPSRSHVTSSGSVWAEPDIDDLAAALREVFEDITTNRGSAAVRAASARATIAVRLEPRTWAQRVSNVASELLTTPQLPPLRVAWITTWGVRCGIAEYSRYLLENFENWESSNGPPSTVVLCDDRTAVSRDGERICVRPSWRLGDATSMKRLARAVATEDPDAVVIQHQPGLFPWYALAGLLFDRRVRHRTTVVTLHAPHHLLVLNPEERAAAIAALGCASRLLVHQIADLELLKSFGLTATSTLFPHGASALGTTRPIRTLSRDASIIIGCHGFFLPGKGIRRLLEAIARLSREWSRLRLRLVNAEYPASESTTEIADCRALAKSLGLDARVEWYTTFLPQHECQRLLAECDLLVLPYDATIESASGALRVALASGTPVAVTPISIFDEAQDAVLRFDGVSVASIAEGIDKLLCDTALRERSCAAASSWLAERDWSVLARRMRGMLTGLRDDALRSTDTISVGGPYANPTNISCTPSDS
jgi:FkbM family methyltransferase